jgi:hypothetical protein
VPIHSLSPEGERNGIGWTLIERLMLFKSLFGIAIGIGIEHAGMIVLFDFDNDPDSEFDPD